MTKLVAWPNRLYKYRNFSNRTLDILVDDQIYFAHPKDFNDPLDTKPTLRNDVENDELERIFRQFFEHRRIDELSKAAEAIRDSTLRTLNHITQLARKESDHLLEEIHYLSTDTSFEVADPIKFILEQEVQDELIRRNDKGVFSLAENDDCPLMWSHYGDEHRGLCLGYSVPEWAKVDLRRVDYGGSRFVEASLLSAMFNGDERASRKVDDAVLLRKATAWSYEREWRLLGNVGKNNCPLELEEVVFGIRCAGPVRYTVAKALEGRRPPVRFYEICEQSGSFELDKKELDIDDLFVGYPRRLDIHKFFEPIDDSK